jgi:hypothetical protein
MHLTHWRDIVQFTCTITCERTNMVEVEYLVIRYGMTCCKTNSPVLFENFLFLAVVELFLLPVWKRLVPCFCGGAYARIRRISSMQEQLGENRHLKGKLIHLWMLVSVLSKATSSRLLSGHAETAIDRNANGSFRGVPRHRHRRGQGSESCRSTDNLPLRYNRVGVNWYFRRAGVHRAGRQNPFARYPRAAIAAATRIRI